MPKSLGSLGTRLGRTLLTALDNHYTRLPLGMQDSQAWEQIRSTTASQKELISIAYHIPPFLYRVAMTIHGITTDGNKMRSKAMLPTQSTQTIYRASFAVVLVSSYLLATSVATRILTWPDLNLAREASLCP